MYDRQSSLLHGHIRGQSVLKFIAGLELVRTIIDHSKIFVLAFNGPAVGGGAAWFLGLADTILAADSCHLQAPFSSLALVPENGSIRTLPHSLGIHRANDILIYGKESQLSSCTPGAQSASYFPQRVSFRMSNFFGKAAERQRR